ncbi:MAG: TonB-dependent receptor [Cyanomargarita calcarea GSE-NOS-MK-12-04C]|jgi:iron complex outermembrane receptor protein|uniref:TonB-dependent receptor n=1 Tax=Cyanomargarita calcarea GSE-NOS-MK-12-04C TaxID=2839659 RepID=A0A951QUH1_9CYAN|nr:TonB-dependent receptor [Cyanomargarita calcarea GSE-NOS-MK-12-04C]
MRLCLELSLFGYFISYAVQPALAEVEAKGKNTEIIELSKFESPATTIDGLVSQSPTPTNPPATQGEVVRITGVKANPTEKGVEVILETAQGDKLQVANRSTGNSFIADITGGQLRLPNGDAFTFKSEKPLSGITEITVTNIDTNSVRVTVVGEKALPAVELFDDNVGLIFAVAEAEVATQPPQAPPVEEKPVTEKPQEKPAAQQDEPIELVVTGEQDGYRVPNASTATRTDTPLRDIPQSIQVVPQEVLRDRNVRNLTDAVETVSGVVDGGSFFGAPAGTRIIRGFGGTLDQSNFRNGSRDVDYFGLTPIGTVEQVEVLKGPASVLFGALEPGGIINVTTKQPLNEPYYKLAFEAGNYGLYQPSIDLSGPLTTDKTLLYRFIASYRGEGSYQAFASSKTTTIAPSLTWKLGDRTTLDIYYEYIKFSGNPTTFEVPLLSDDSFPSRNFFSTYPDFLSQEYTTQKYGYRLNHKFNDNWQIRNNVAITQAFNTRTDIFATSLVDDRFLTGFQLYADDGVPFNNYFGQIDLLGKFSTGSISHQILAGVDFNRNFNRINQLFFSDDFPDLDILSPNYNVPTPQLSLLLSDFAVTNEFYGIYLQDQIAFSNNLKLLIGGRYDWAGSIQFWQKYLNSQGKHI